MKQQLADYAAIIFDCDGVVLNSNRLKSEAFYRAALPYGEGPARALLAYHQANGGISRYKKFAYFFEELLSIPIEKDQVEAALASYARYVQEGLKNCEVAQGLVALREALPRSQWCICSGGDQAELRSVFVERGLSKLFDAGIYGSPDSKSLIIARLLEEGTIQRPALFLGDARYDHEVSRDAELDFVFISAWSEFADWPGYCEERALNVFPSIGALLPLLLPAK
jgi:phosphoglycolate phosphatase-like HAD superfamily hydrolase